MPFWDQLGLPTPCKSSKCRLPDAEIIRGRNANNRCGCRRNYFEHTISLPPLFFFHPHLPGSREDRKPKLLDSMKELRSCIHSPITSSSSWWLSGYSFVGQRRSGMQQQSIYRRSKNTNPHFIDWFYRLIFPRSIPTCSLASCMLNNRLDRAQAVRTSYCCCCCCYCCC